MQHGSPAKQTSTKKHPAFALIFLPLLLKRVIGFCLIYFSFNGWELAPFGNAPRLSEGR